jgi:hypothetical protein
VARLAFQRPHTLAEVVQRLKAGEPWALTVPEFLDTFYLALRGGNEVAPQSCIAAEPAHLADPRQNALLGAVGEHLATRWSLLRPSWTEAPERFLTEPFYDGTDQAADIAWCSPEAFRRRNIFTEVEPLRRARLPHPKHFSRDHARGYIWTPHAIHGVFGAAASAAFSVDMMTAATRPPVSLPIVT